MNSDMRNIVLLIVLLLCVTVSGEIITMDLTTATDMVSNPVSYSTEVGEGYYDCTDVWDSTYNDSGLCQFIYTNDARFMLSHMPSMASYGGTSWEGFTLSKVSEDTANVFGCVANGGLAGVGSPYAIGYFSDWVTESQGYSSNIILFDQEYFPMYIYVCQNSNTMQAIAHGGVFNANVFTENDTLALIIGGLNNSLEETETLTYYLAVDGEMNDGWVKVPLTAIGKTAGLSFRMSTTDMGEWGANTPMYFAIDGLTVNTEMTSDLPQNQTCVSEYKKMIYAGQMYIVGGNEVYTAMGQRVQ